MIYIRGYSGDAAYRLGNIFVKETDGDPRRLLHQAHKQMKYRSKLLANEQLSKYFYVPRVMSVYSNGFTMEYVEGNSIIDVMNKEGIDGLASIFDKLEYLLDYEFHHTVKRPFRVKPFIKKLSPSCPVDIRECIIMEVKKRRFTWLPIGLMHGDLSCANMLFYKDKIVLLDLLKVFYRTPYQDIAKLYQEMDLHWAMLMSDYSNETSKIKSGYDYLTHRLNTWVDNTAYIDKRFVNLFRLMCVARLFPYVNSADTGMQKLVYKKCLDIMEEM